jgi:hypothetical protein
VVITNHHDPYVSLHEWDEMQAILRSNARSPDHGSAGHGHAQAQGLVRCARHGERIMGTRYKKGCGNRSYSYRCLGDYQIGGTVCVGVPGAPIDDAVASAVMDRLSPPNVAMLRAELHGVIGDEHAARRQREMEIARLRIEAADLEQKLAMLDAASHGVFKRLEKRLQSAEQQIEHLEGLTDADGPNLRRDTEVLAELESLVADLGNIWNAPTTTNRDRKELLRTLVRRVVVEGRDDGRVRIRIEWLDGVPALKRVVWSVRGVWRLISERVRHGRSAKEISDELSRLQVRNVRGKEWTPGRVRDAIVVMRRTGRLPAASRPSDTARRLVIERVQEGVPSRAIANELARLGVRTAGGNEWSPKRVKWLIWQMRSVGKLPPVVRPTNGHPGNHGDGQA